MLQAGAAMDQPDAVRIQSMTFRGQTANGDSAISTRHEGVLRTA